MMTEADLLQRCRDGDSTAWEVLYRDHAGRIERFVRLGSRGDVDVADLVQDVFIEVLRSLPSFRGDSSFTTWLYRVASRVVLRAARTERRRQGRELVARELLHPDTLTVPTALRRVCARQELRDVESALAMMPAPIRIVWIMREIEVLDVPTIAEALGISRVTVRTRYFRARRRILLALGRDTVTVAKPLASEAGP